LLTDLTGRDYWHASAAAAWRRGRGYLVSAAMLWLALGISGQVGWGHVAAAAVGGALIWGFAFAVGFRAFATGHQTSGVASLLTLGLPLVLAGLVEMRWLLPAHFVPAGLSFLPLRPDGFDPLAWGASVLLIGGATAWLTRTGLARCDADLRAWYDQNQGRRVE
jgi:hypothetical protein